MRYSSIARAAAGGSRPGPGARTRRRPRTRGRRRPGRSGRVRRPPPRRRRRRRQEVKHREAGRQLAAGSPSMATSAVAQRRAHAARCSASRRSNPALEMSSRRTMSRPTRDVPLVRATVARRSGRDPPDNVRRPAPPVITRPAAAPTAPLDVRAVDHLLGVLESVGARRRGPAPPAPRPSARIAIAVEAALADTKRNVRVVTSAARQQATTAGRAPARHRAHRPTSARSNPGHRADGAGRLHPYTHR